MNIESLKPLGDELKQIDKHTHEIYDIIGDAIIQHIQSTITYIQFKKEWHHEEGIELFLVATNLHTSELEMFYELIANIEWDKIGCPNIYICEDTDVVLSRLSE